jgi:TolB-like protein/class 3 adenylate cyclase
VAGERVERRLAAVVAADVAGYSRLMSVDEVGTLAALKAYRREVVDPTIAAYHGRIVKTTGDGMLVEFASAVDAVTCAVDVQEKMAERAASGAEPRILFRVGINVGDIIIDSDDIFGDGVNVAARVENECEPGGVCLSGSAFEQVRDKTSFAFDDLGERSLKNIDRPVRLYAAGPAKSSQAASTKPAAERHKPLPLPERPSIAVLPFENISGDVEQEYFADGMVEDITTALSRFKSLFVIARNSSFTYKGKAIDIKQIGRELGVRYILEGSVRKAANHLRITGQLIDAFSGAHIWAEHYDRQLSDVFELQDEITRSVVSEIEPNLMRAEISRARAKPTETLAAYDFYLRALPEFHSFTEQGFNRSREFLTEALRRDQYFSDAWAALADCTSRMAIAGWLEWDQASDQACHAARRAIETGSENGIGLAIASLTLALMGRNFEEASEIAERALILHPNASSVCTNCGWVSVYIAQYSRAIALLETGRRMSPLDPRAYLNMNATATAHLFSKDFEGSLFWSERVLSKWPSHSVALQNRAAALSLLGRLEEAEIAVSRLLDAKPSASASLIRRRRVLDNDMQERIIDALRVAGLPERTRA